MDALEDEVGKVLGHVINEILVLASRENVQRLLAQLENLVPAEHSIAISVNHLEEQVYLLRDVRGSQLADALKEVGKGDLVCMSVRKIPLKSRVNDSVDYGLVFQEQLGNPILNHAEVD